MYKLKHNNTTKYKGALFIEYALLLAFVLVGGTMFISDNNIAASIKSVFDGAAQALEITDRQETTKYDTTKSIGEYVLSETQKQLNNFKNNKTTDTWIDNGNLSHFFSTNGINGSLKTSLTLPDGKTVDVIIYNRNYDTYEDIKTRLKVDNTASMIYNSSSGEISTIIYNSNGNYSLWTKEDGWSENTYKL